MAKVSETNRVRFETQDGCLIMNRKASDWAFDSFKTDSEFLKMTLTADSREHGVKVISHKLINETKTLTAVVAYI